MFVTEKRARIGRVLVLLGVVNFAVFWIVGACIGGDAVSGRSEDGHYFVSNHGQLTEVTHAVFLYSRIHSYSVWITHPLAAAGYWVSHVWRRRNPK